MLILKYKDYVNNCLVKLKLHKN